MAVRFKWLKLRGAGKNLAVTHQAIDKYDAEKQDLLDHELGLHAAIEAKSFRICWRQQDLTCILCSSLYYGTLLRESLELGVDVIDDEGRCLVPTLSFIELYAGAPGIWNDTEHGSYAVVHFPIARLVPTAAKARVAE